MNRVALDLGVVQIYWYSIMILLGVFVALTLISYESKRLKKDSEEIINILINTILIGILGARLYFIAFNFSDYSNNFFGIFEIWNGGLAIHGAILFGGVYLYVVCKKRKKDLLTILDISSLGLIIGQAIGRWGNFFNQEAYGQITTLGALQRMHLPQFIIDAMEIGGFYRQPTFLYESLWNLLGFIIMMFIRKKKYLKKGQLLSFYLIWYSSARFIIEHFRDDSLMLGPLKVAQLVSLGLIAVGIYIIIKNRKGTKLDNLYNPSAVRVTTVEAKEETNKEIPKSVKKFKTDHKPHLKE